MLCFYQNPAGERVRKHDKDENQIKESESQKLRTPFLQKNS